MDKERQHVKGATGGKDRQMWRINHLSFSVQAHTRMHARTHAGRNRPLALSSFSCDVIEAVQQTLKPEAELRPSTTAKNYRLHS